MYISDDNIIVGEIIISAILGLDDWRQWCLARFGANTRERWCPTKYDCDRSTRLQ